MNLIFDGIIVGVCVIAIVLGAKRGFIKSVMGVCTLIAALFVAYAFSPAVSSYIQKQPFITDIADSITETLKSLSENEEGTYDLDRLFEDMPDAFQQIIDRYRADTEELTEAIPPLPDSDADTVDALSTLIAKPVVRTISDVLAYLALFVATVIALKLLTALLDLIFQLPVLKTANTFLGLLIGILCALLLAWVLSTLSVALIRAMSSISPDLFNESIIDNTIVLKFFSTHNFEEIVSKLLP